MPKTMSFEEQQDAVKSAISKSAKGSDSKVLNRVNKQKENEDKFDVLDSVLHKLLHETMDMIRDGEMDMEEGLKDFTEAVLVIEKEDLKVPKSKGKDSEKDKSEAVPSDIEG